MEPPKVGAPGVVSRKQMKWSSMVEETPQASASKPSFHIDYIPPRKDTTPQVWVAANGKYPVVTPEIPLAVIVKGDKLGKVATLKFVDHDITNMQKFPDMAWEQYLYAKSVTGTRAIMLELQEWSTTL
jgi:hypothetical protein